MSIREFTPKENIKIGILSRLAFYGLLPIDKSIRFKHINLNDQSIPAIYAIWHGYQYGLLGLPNRNKLNLLVSPSNDGEIISRTTKLMGYSTIRGSKGRRGAEAIREVITSMKNGESIAYTVDGPRGPIYKVKPGIIKVAQMAQVPIIPIVPATTTKVVINSWDKYTIPHVFSKIINMYGDPIYIPKDLSTDEIESYRLNLENLLLSLKPKVESLNWNKIN